MTLPRTTAEVFADHALFQIECVDRMYLNVYAPNLQFPKGLIGYLREAAGRERAVASVDRVHHRSGQPLLLLRGLGLRAVLRQVLLLFPRAP